MRKPRGNGIAIPTRTHQGSGEAITDFGIVVASQSRSRPIQFSILAEIAVTARNVSGLADESRGSSTSLFEWFAEGCPGGNQERSCLEFSSTQASHIRGDRLRR
jgi:hypothetical protein